MWYAGVAAVFIIVKEYISNPLPFAAEGALPPTQSKSILLVLLSILIPVVQ